MIRKPLGSSRRLRRVPRGMTLECLETRQVLDSTVVFSELMYNPVGANDAQLEWIELYNQLAVDMDISDWVLDGGVSYRFPDQTIVPGRGYLLVASDPAALDQQAGLTALGPWEGQLSNRGEEVRLYNNDERLMNVVAYEDGGDWPVAPDATGLTLAKRARETNSTDAENWTFSEQVGGTPGRDNFVEPGRLLVDPLVTSPAPLTAHVPTDDQLGTTWTQLNFDDSAWLSGNGGVGFDSATTYNSYLGIDLDEPPDGQPATPMRDVNTSVYLRIPFEIRGDVPQFDSLELGVRYDDGFVAYLNGTEIAAANAPGRNGLDGTLAWDSASTRSNNDRNAVQFETFLISDAAGLLRPGENLLAIQGLNGSLVDSDALYDAELKGISQIPVPTIPPLRINEVAAAGDPSFFVEVVNFGSEPLPLNGYRLATTNPALPGIALPAQTLAAGAQLAITAAQLGGQPDESDRLVLFAPGDLALDAVRVTDRLQGRAAARDDRWMYPSQATPGSANVFALHDEIVINEIMYHPAPELGIPDTLPTYESSVVLPMTWDAWRFNATGAQLPGNWAEQNYSVDGSNWLMGQAPVGYETSSLEYPIATEVTRPSAAEPRFSTYYFQTDFELTADQLAKADRISLSHLIDDGAIFYLNGVEIERFNMPSGPVDATTLAGSTVSNAARVGPVDIPAEWLRAGTNTLSVEVHNRSASDSDVVFAVELSTATQVTDLIPGRPYRERDELDWLELYNRGSQAVNLGGWKLQDGAQFEFPNGTVLGAGEYLVIAKDAAAFSVAYPGVPVMGDYGGNLSNHDELIRLYDANSNLADEVHYFEGGRWPATPDGGGSSLELKDPDADNNLGESWAASDESDKGGWVTHTFRGVSQRDVYNQAARFNEFIFGLLDAGEFLIDNVQVIKDPSGEAKSLIQNGTFEADQIGTPPAKWRLIGNHSGTVEVDPTNPDNQVLHVVATGAQAHVHDHAETTFIDNDRISDGVEYEISFQAKWLTGNSQLNSRLWFGRLSSTARLDAPSATGTPGAPNSSHQENIGPTFEQFSHAPVTPQPTESVTVSVRPDDPDGVARVTLWWREDRQEWNSVAMTVSEPGQYQAEIPPHAAGRVVQFYVEAEDNLGAVSTFPAAGPESRALYEVEDGQGPTTPIDRFRLVLLREDEQRLFAAENRMSNWVIPMTLMHNDTAFYNVTVRQIGSRWIRPDSGYKVTFNQDQPLYGVHDSVRFDLNGLAEIVMKQMLNRAGGSKASNYDDLGYLVSPRSSHTHPVIVQLARYENVYLDEQFVNGTDGTKWELDDVTVPISPVGGIEGLKTGTEVNTGADIGVSGQVFAQQGSDPEFYRGHLLIKSNRAKDDFQQIVRLATAIHKDGQDLFEATNEVMDVDLWMRHYAHQSYLGNWDTYGFGRPKNLRIYLRPEDDRFVPLFWDCDLCNFTEVLKKRTEPTSRLDEIRDIPHNLRLYWGHMLDLVNRSFNREYVERWAAHYGSLVDNYTNGGDENFVSIINSTNARNNTVMRDLERDIPRVEFEITTNGGENVTVETPTLLLEGKGWVDVRQIRRAGSSQAYDVFWPETDGWQFELSLSGGAEEIVLEAVDYEGNIIATDRLTVTSTTPDPVLESLRLTEIQYHPADASPAEIAAGFENADDFEYLELTNIGSESISMAGVEFVRGGDDGQQGVAFAFDGSPVTELAPGATVLVVENLDAARLRYGDDVAIAGQWSGGLSNAGELITLLVNQTVLHTFTYDDAWFPETDGDGRSLQIIDARQTQLADWGAASSWRPSAFPLGTPGETEPAPGDANRDGVFDSIDLLIALQAGEYEDMTPNNSSFSEGDFNGDGDFDSADLVWAFQYNLYSGDAPAARPLLANALPLTQIAQTRRSTEAAGASAYDPPPATTRPSDRIALPRRRFWHLHERPVDEVFALPKRSLTTLGHPSASPDDLFGGWDDDLPSDLS